MELITIQEDGNTVTVSIAGFVETYNVFFDLTYVNLLAVNMGGVSKFEYGGKTHRQWDASEINKYHLDIRRVRLYNRYVWPILRLFKIKKMREPSSYRIFIYGGHVMSDK
jgi:hypothetical protein